MSLIMLIAMAIYRIVEEGSNFYIFSILARAFGAVAVVCDTEITPGEAFAQ